MNSITTTVVMNPGLLCAPLFRVSKPHISSSSTDERSRDITSVKPYTMANTNSFALRSPLFDNGGVIPSKYTCDGENINPPLTIENTPPETASLVLIVDDPDVPQEVKPDRMFTHWVVYNISPETRVIPEGEAPPEALEGQNSAGKNEYTGPCPPTQYEPTEHRYIFTLYALNIDLDLGEGATKEEVKEALDGHVIDKAELIGRYDRTQQ